MLGQPHMEPSLKNGQDTCLPDIHRGKLYRAWRELPGALEDVDSRVIAATDM